MSNLSQDNRSVSAYFTKCKLLWDEYIALVAPCSCDSTGSAMKLIGRQQLMQFLMGLNDCYQTVRSKILMLSPLPSVSQASSVVLQEEHQREIKAFSVQQPELDSSSAFLSQQKPQYANGRSLPQTLSKPSYTQGFQQSSSSLNTI